MTNQDRIKYYFGDFYDKQINIIIPENFNKLSINEPFFYRGGDFPGYRNNPQLSPCFWYQEDLCLDIPCMAINSDGYDNKGFPAFSKTRLIDGNNLPILLKLQMGRHWNILNDPLPDIPWKQKKSEVVWRGNHVCGLWKKPNRVDLVSKYYLKHNIRFWTVDVELYKYDSNEFKYYNENRHLFDPNFLSIEDQLKYKYIISIEGNDVATGLKWSLASNSLVLMPEPKYETWLMEGLLEPWVHYIPLNNELSDLEDKIEWCKSNDGVCQDIVSNAKNFMKPFLDYKNERHLFEEMLRLYSKNITFTNL